MKLTISANLIFTDMQKELAETVEQELIFRNPRYFVNQHLGLYNNPESPTFKLARVGSGVVEVPRGYNFNKLLPYITEVDNRTVGEEITGKLEFNNVTLTPFPFQEKAADVFIRWQQGGVIAPCGAGKTELAINIINKLRVPTLILVHKKELVDQWKERIETKLGYTPGVIHGAKKTIQPITIATVQSLYSTKGLMTFNEASFYSKFAMVILDEAHHAPAASWDAVVSKCPAKYRLWLTATEERKDGLGFLIPITCGGIIYRIDHQELLNIGRIMRPQYQRHDLSFIQGKFVKNALIKGEKKEIVDRLALDRYLTKHKSRNQYIIDQVVKDYEVGRHILVVSPKFTEHCELLWNGLNDRGVPAQLLTASGPNAPTSKQRDQLIKDARSGKVRCIVATNIAEEGLDIPILDTCHLAYPVTECEQTVGRISRACPGKNNAIVQDYLDITQEYLVDRYKRRIKFFQEIGTPIPSLDY